MASRTTPMSNCPPMVFLTPISTLSKSMNTAIRVLRGSVVTFISLSRVWRRSVELLRGGADSWGLFQYMSSPCLFRGQRRRVFDVGWNYAGKLTALEQFTSLAAPTGHLVLGCADRLFAPAARLHPEEIAVAHRRHEAKNVVIFSCQLDQDDSLARS